jgi:hypothetical protein
VEEKLSGRSLTAAACGGLLPTWRAPLQDVELMPQHQDLGLKPPSRFEEVAQSMHEKEDDCDHPAIVFWFARN